MTGNQQAFQKAMNQGHSAAWDQNWEKATDYYRQALQEFPNNPNALNSLGLALFELQQYEESLVCYHKAAQLSTNDPMPLEKMARIYERLGQLPEAFKTSTEAAELYLKGRDANKAIENWLRALSLNPDHLPVHTRLAMVYERLGRKDEAASEYLAAASLLQRMGNLTKAAQIVDYVLQFAPHNAEAKQAVTMLRNKQLLPKPARPRGGTGPVRMAEVRQLEQQADAENSMMDPIAEARKRALVQLAELLFEQAEDEAPSGQVNRRGFTSLTRGTGGLSLSRAERTRVLLYLGQAIESQTQGQNNQSAEELERAVEAGLSHPAAYFDLGMLLQQSNTQKAMGYLQKSVKHPDFSLPSYLLMAQIYQQEDNLSSAASCYLQALRLADSETVPKDQVDELLQLYEPVIEAQSRQTDEAALKRLCDNVSSELLRNDWRTYLYTARQNLPAQPQGAPPLPLAEMLLETSSHQVVEMLAHVRQLASQNHLPSAVEEAFYALQFAPTYLPLHTQVAELLMKEGRTQEAVTKFLLVGELYSLRGEAAQAVRLLNRVSQLAPMDLSVRHRLIEVLIDQGRTDDAIRQYMSLADVYYHLAELNMARQTYAAALRVAQQGRSDRNLTLSILYKIADIDQQRLDWRQAVRIFEQIRTLEPEDPEARTRLVELNFRLNQESAGLAEIESFTALLENSGKRQQAIDFLANLIPERPEMLELHKRLADLYIRDKQIPQAVLQLDTIADALLSAGNRPAAIAILQAIIRLNPSNVAEYQQALTQLQ
ncbi:MAG: tetratricopeptide repeat protein [Chloroflexi bacterium]|nr:tetratricopeptide repeat protein [Anaerolineaceae bacterium]NMB88845.1 tetratricopeptide repeat protein [Chloroflexota bacterium]